MKKKMVISMALLLLLAAIVFPVAEARAATMNATGSCGMSRVGKSVTFSGLTSSNDDEDIIRVTMKTFIFLVFVLFWGAKQNKFTCICM